MTIEIRDVSFRYSDSYNGVENIKLSIRKGECVVITGPSGGGKSTLTRLINGLAPLHFSGDYNGSIYINGLEAESLKPWERGKIVGSVFQDPKSQFFSSELVGEISFASENFGLPHEEIVLRTNNAIDVFGLEKLKHRSIDLLSSGEKQRVAIASVHAISPEVYVCDEPTANLDDEGALELSQTFMELKKQGKTLVIAEHRLAWLYGIADRFIYVTGGAVIWDKTATEMRKFEQIEYQKYGLRRVTSVKMPILNAPSNDKDAYLIAEDISFHRKSLKILENVSFCADSGQIVAITGNNGAGKTTFAHILSGLKRENGGRVLINGVKVARHNRRKNIWYGSNDTSSQFFTNSVSEEILLHAKYSEEQIERARNILKLLELYEYKDAHPSTLSGGQKQRLSIACAILSDRKVLLLDEPTSGLDGRNMKIIASVLKEAASNGRIILIITHDNELVSECCSFRYQFTG